MNKQQLCAELNVSEFTLRRLEQLGLPCTLMGMRTKRYDLEACKAWLKARPGVMQLPAPKSSTICLSPRKIAGIKTRDGKTSHTRYAVAEEARHLARTAMQRGEVFEWY